MSAQEHARYEHDAGAYVLGALDQVERRDFERHLATCATCVEEVQRLRPAVDALPRTVAPLAAPPTLKRSLMDVVEQEAAAASPPARPRASRRERLAGMLPWGERASPAFGWAAAAIVLALGVIAGFGIARTTGEEGAQTVRASVDERRTPFASARLVMPDGGEDGGTLHARGLPPLERGRTYQAWIQSDDKVIPGPLFSPGRDGTATAAIPRDMGEVDAVMVTRESRRGAEVPSERPVVEVEL
jgi:Anti-sigma-K factor rskA/Putative zinc-finger